MPLYNFQNIKTGEVIEKSMKISEREEYLEQNPHMKQVTLKAPPIGDSVRLGIRHHDQNFNDVLKNIKSHHHGSTLNPR